MNFLILLIMLMILIAFAIKFENGDVFAPAPLLCEVYFVSVFFAMIASKMWEAKLSFWTVFIIISGLTFFIAGMIFAKGTFAKVKLNKKRSNKTKIINAPIIIDKKILYFICIYCVLGIYQVFSNTYQRAKNIDPSVTLVNFMSIIRAIEGAGGGTGNTNYMEILLNYSINGLGYVFTFIIIYNFLNFRLKKNLILNIVPCITMFIGGILSSGRAYLISWIAVILVMGVLIYYKKNNVKTIKLGSIIKFGKYAIIGLTVFFIMFQLLGLLTGKTQTADTFEMIAGYTGSSVVAFDEFLKVPISDNKLWGEEAFQGIYSLSSKFSLNQEPKLHLPFIEFGNNYTTNVYTSLRTYIHDFGYIGMYIVEFILGSVLTVVYIKIKNVDNNLDKLLFCYIYSGFALQGIEELFLRSFFSITQILTIIFIIIFYYLLVYKKIVIKT